MDYIKQKNRMNVKEVLSDSQTSYSTSTKHDFIDSFKIIIWITILTMLAIFTVYDSKIDIKNIIRRT